MQDRATGTFWDCPRHLGQLNSLWLSPSYLCAYHCPLTLVPNLQGEEGMAGLSWTILTPRECPVGCGDSGSTPQLWSPAGFQELQSSCHHGFHVRTPVSIYQSGRLAQERNFPMLSPHCLTSWQIYHIGLEFIMLDFTSWAGQAPQEKGLEKKPEEISFCGQGHTVISTVPAEHWSIFFFIS